MKTPTDYLAAIGRRGGKKGGKASGPSKRRGDGEYYRQLAAKRKRVCKEPSE